MSAPRHDAVLRWLARVAVLGLGADEACVLGFDADGGPRLVHCTGPRAREAEQWQEQACRGPAVTAAAYGQVLTVPDWHVDRRDPGVRVRALLGGLRSVTAVPIGAQGRVESVIDLWWQRPAALTAAQQAAIAHLRSTAGAELEISAQRDAADRAREGLESGAIRVDR
ncbi:GAF domain-containing protein [Actinotalea sp. M2MS4P-6]|uniref:GAF domain-containing protein n=1 Tax=Actinotalea sp. M2MS4P-6 TaxID=2983762 RepID=UPI0021E40DBC|nr:GAF domain-containing protein [Actinotalea sp. M2MS4P-6]MCV2393306.1 GAF domain-containing protein [Actinotalea sp. M2MS4P-6]